MYIGNAPEPARPAVAADRGRTMPPSHGGVSRRQLLSLAGASVAGSALASCDLLSTEPEGAGTGGGAGEDERAKEAPELREVADAGELPPLADRLPAEPMVLEAPDEPGQYGGDLNMLLLPDQTSSVRLNSSFGYEGLVRWRPETTALTPDRIIPNVAKSFEGTADGTEYTFILRAGMRWSDGELFTADDILFWYEDVAMNAELSPAFPAWLNTGGDEPLVVEKVDEQTVAFRFSAPYALFIEDLATPRGRDLTAYPAHYLKQFHADHAEDLDAALAEAGVDNWVDLFAVKASLANNPELPVLNAWVMTGDISDATTQQSLERNPYYWKTDSEGSQLPYINRVIFHLVQGPDAGILKVTNGEIDVVDRDVNELSNKPVLAQHRDAGAYRFFDTIPIKMNQMIIMVNMTHRDPVLREIFSNKDFRIGLSHAINRTDIIDTVFQRQGEPWQGAPRPESPYHNEQLAKQYTEFDQQVANEHLDRVVPDKDADGKRLRPDGKPLFFQVEINNAFAPHIDIMELVKEQWREVGIEIAVKVESGSLFFERTGANQHDAAVGDGGGGLTARTDPVYYMPFNFNARWATPWYLWYQNPDDPIAEEPPSVPRQQMDVYREFRSTTDRDQQNDLMNEVMAIAADQFYCIGIAMRRREYGVFKSNLRNTPEECITGWGHVFLMPTNPQLYYFADV